MSYSFGMFFKEIDNAAEALRFISEVTKTLYNNGYEYIEQNKYSIPSIDHDKSMPETDSWFLYGLFALKFAYWEEEKLLGLSGYQYPKEVEDMFDTHVCFQNGADQDYPYKDWNDKIHVFAEEKEKVKTLSEKEIYKMHDIDEKYQNDEELEYWRRSTLYNNIFSRLDLDGYINNTECKSHMVIQTCSIKTIYEHAHLNACVRRTVKAYLDEANEEKMNE